METFEPLIVSEKYFFGSMEGVEGLRATFGNFATRVPSALNYNHERF